jgi:hypothetical protein
MDPKTEVCLCPWGALYTGLMSPRHILLENSFKFLSARYHEPVIMFSFDVVSVVQSWTFSPLVTAHMQNLCTQ